MISSSGVIAGYSYAANGDTHAALAVPVMLADLQNPANPKIISTMPAQAQGQTTAAYDQRPVPDGSIAYITGAATNPLMPQLVASLPSTLTGLSVKWRLEVVYDRGNGYHADFNQPTDTVHIPLSGNNTAPVWSDEMDSSEPWNLSQTDDWNWEVTHNGFFGGTAKLYVWLTDFNPTAPTDPVIIFRIGGQNHDPDDTKSYIDTHANTAAHPFWYAYMIARKESIEYAAPVPRPRRYYNQFYTVYQGETVGLSGNMNWVGWATGWPTYNYDRVNGQPNGPGGYGLFQLTLGPKLPNGDTTHEPFISRGQIWNWQNNVDGAINELAGKVTYANNLSNWLSTNFPSIQQFHGDGCFTVQEAIVVGLYNGEGTFKKLTAPNGSKRKSPWISDKNGHWLLSSSYVKEVETYK